MVEYSDQSSDTDSDSQEICIDKTLELKTFRLCSDSENRRFFKASSKTVKNKTFTIENILGLEDNSDDNDKSNKGCYGKSFPIISPTDLRQISKSIKNNLNYSIALLPVRMLRIPVHSSRSNIMDDLCVPQELPFRYIEKHILLG